MNELRARPVLDALSVIVAVLTHFLDVGALQLEKTLAGLSAHREPAVALVDDDFHRDNLAASSASA